MHRLLAHIKIEVSPQLYLKNPDSTEVGRRIIEHSIVLIEELGFEAYTFKKLGERIGSPESTVYRYFENKHMLLVYLISWYWSWLEYRVVLSTINVSKPQEALQKALAVLTQAITDDTNFSHISESTLQKIVIAESSKAFLTKEVDEENQKGYFVSYQRLVSRMVELVRESDPNFTYPKTLVTIIIEGYHQQRFFADHFPGLTDCSQAKQSLQDFFNILTFSLLKNGKV